MIRTRACAFLADEPPVLCDWLPWNHTFGGNHNFGLVLYNGGTLYIDEGRPTPDGYRDHRAQPARDRHDRVLQRAAGLRDAAAAPARPTRRCAERFFSRLQDALLRRRRPAASASPTSCSELAVDTCGEDDSVDDRLRRDRNARRSRSAPGAEGASSGVLGVPVPGVELKLAPVGTKMEARAARPQHHARLLARRGADARPRSTRRASTGSAMRCGSSIPTIRRRACSSTAGSPRTSSCRPARGSASARCARAFWRASTASRTTSSSPRPDRDYVGALIFPNLTPARHCAGLAAGAPAGAIVNDARVRAQFQAILDELAREGTGSSTLVARAILLDEPPSIDAREITDKGSINQKAVLRNRSALVDELYDAQASPRVLVGYLGPGTRDLGRTRDPGRTRTTNQAPRSSDD